MELEPLTSRRASRSAGSAREEERLYHAEADDRVRPT
jgi:hypothetical protein